MLEQMGIPTSRLYRAAWTAFLVALTALFLMLPVTLYLAGSGSFTAICFALIDILVILPFLAAALLSPRRPRNRWLRLFLRPFDQPKYYRSVPRPLLVVFATLAAAAVIVAALFLLS